MQAFCYQHMFSQISGGESIDVEMKVDLALDTRDALAKSIYAAVFKCGS